MAKGNQKTPFGLVATHFKPVAANLPELKIESGISIHYKLLVVVVLLAKAKNFVVNMPSNVPFATTLAPEQLVLHLRHQPRRPYYYSIQCQRKE